VTKPKNPSIQPNNVLMMTTPDGGVQLVALTPIQQVGTSFAPTMVSVSPNTNMALFQNQRLSQDSQQQTSNMIFLPQQPQGSDRVQAISSASFDCDGDEKDLISTSVTPLPPPRGNNANIRSASEVEGDRPEYLLDEIQARVDLNSILNMSPVTEDGQKRLDANRVKILLAKFRGVPPTGISNTDPAIEFLVDLSLIDCKQLFASCPTSIVAALRGKNDAQAQSSGNKKSIHNVDEMSDNEKVDFLNAFSEKCNIKQVYSTITEETKKSNPALEKKHARLFIANLREVTFSQVLETDPGVEMLVGKTMSQLREMLSSIELEKVRLLDLKSYYFFLQKNSTDALDQSGEN